MATTTTNLGLTKPAYSETADIAVINSNMDKIDTAANALENGMAIVANGNTHGAITSGQFVYARNHGTLSEGLYTANSNISANATLTSSNLSAVSGGGLNSLNDQMANISALVTGVVTWNTENVDGDASRKNWFRTGGKIVIASLEFTPLSGRIFHNAVICSGLPAPFAGSGIFTYGGNTQQMTINTNGDLCWYYPTDRTTLGRVDTTIVYIMQ